VQNLPVAVTVQSELQKPESHKLYPNYPNPFNASTVVRYDVPKSTKIKLAVFDLLGRRVRVLVDGYQNAGRYTVTWDGRDDDGIDVTSGIYLIYLKSSGAQQWGKVLLTR